MTKKVTVMQIIIFVRDNHNQIIQRLLKFIVTFGQVLKRLVKFIVTFDQVYCNIWSSFITFGQVYSFTVTFGQVL
jgi:hypothetical protein